MDEALKIIIKDSIHCTCPECCKRRSAENSEKEIDKPKTSVKIEEITQNIKNMKTISFATAILIEINSFRESQKDFSAHDIAMAIRKSVNDKNIELLEVMKFENNNGDMVSFVDAAVVKFFIEELFDNKLIANYSMYKSVGYKNYIFDKRTSDMKTFSAAWSASTTTNDFIATDVKDVKMDVGATLTPLMTAISAYIDNKLAKNETPTIKSLQSRLKGISTKTGDLMRKVTSLGYKVAYNSQIPSRSSITA